MDVFSFAINESQWMLCLVQVTGLMLMGWAIGRVTLRKFPDVSASIGVVVLAASAGLIVITLVDVPRPFELTTSTYEVADASTLSKSSLPKVDDEPDTNPNASAASWLNQLVSMVSFTSTSATSADITENKQHFISPDRFIGLLILLTFLGGLVGIFRVAHSSWTIRSLAKSSSPIEDRKIRYEVARIVAQLPKVLGHQNISVHQFSGPGSPFVSWLTGSKIFVPETFLDWSASEQSTGLAHEISHLQRRDHFCRLLTQLTFCLTWLHPLAWLLHRQTVLAQELAADQLAAQTSENPSAYCRGLSRLALRFDAECRHPSALGVSVSSSLIRRITMLKEITFHRLPCSRLVNRCITLSAFVACTWIACWSVEGQTAPQEKKVDSKVVTASHTTPVKMFSQPTTQPWDAIGNQPRKDGFDHASMRTGYLNVQVNRLLEHPELKPHVPMITAALDGALLAKPNATSSSLKQFGLSLDEITQFQGGAFVSVVHNPEATEGHRTSLSLGVSGIEITAVNQVDWPSLLKAVDLTNVIGSAISKDDLNKMRDEWLKSAKKSRSNVFQSVPLVETPTINVDWTPTETKKALWEAVSGGVATVVYDIARSGEAPEGYKESDELNQANFEMTTATETAAWGFDLSPDFKTFQIRFAAVPTAKVSTDELLEMFEAVIDAFLKSVDPNDDDLPEDFLEQMKKLKVTVVKGKTFEGETTKPYLLVEGECSADILKGRFPEFLSSE